MSALRKLHPSLSIKTSFNNNDIIIIIIIIIIFSSPADSQERDGGQGVHGQEHSWVSRQQGMWLHFCIYSVSPIRKEKTGPTCVQWAVEDKR